MSWVMSSPTGSSLTTAGEGSLLYWSSSLMSRLVAMFTDFGLLPLPPQRMVRGEADVSEVVNS